MTDPRTADAGRTPIAPVRSTGTTPEMPAPREDTGLDPVSHTRRRSRLRSLAGYAVGLLIVVCLYRAIGSSAHSLRGASLKLTIPTLLIGLGSGLAASVLSVWSWHAALQTLGVRCSFPDASRVWYRSMVARYVPGTLPGIAYRVALTTELGADRALAAAATVMDWVCWLLSALLACLVTAPWWASKTLGLPAQSPGFGPHSASAWSALSTGQWVAAGLILPLGLALLHPRVIGFLLRKASRKADTGTLPLLSFRRTLALLPIYLAKWPFYGLSMAVFLPAIAATGHGSGLAGSVLRTPDATGAFALGWVGGFLSPFAPGGLGVREGIIVGILHAGAATQVVLEAAILSRLLTTIAEVLCWLWACVPGGRSPRTKCQPNASAASARRIASH